MSVALRILGLCLLVGSSCNGTFGQTSIPSTPYEAQVWLHNSSNSFKTNERGEVIEVTIDYVPRVFVIGDLDVFPQLQSLTIGYTGRFHDQHMSGVARLTSLKKLVFRHCDSLTEASLAVLRYLPNLEELELNECDAVFSIAPLSQCAKLRKLTFSENNQFDFSGLRAIVELPHLESLVLASNATLRDPHLRELGKLTGLKELNLASCTEVTDEGLSCLESLPGLKVLELSSCPKVTGESLKFIAQELEELDLGSTGLNDGGLQQLSRLKYLKRLQIDRCPAVTGVGLENLRYCPELETLVLGGSPVSEEHFQPMSEFKNLKKLDLANCDKITGGAIGYLQHCVQLEDLSLADCRRINTPDIGPLLQFKNLKVLNLDGTRVGTDGIEMLTGLPCLEWIDLSNNNWIDDESIAALSNVPSLKKVVLQNVSRISDDALRSLGKLPDLEELLVATNNKITAEGLDGFSDDSPLRKIELLRLNRLSPVGVKNLRRFKQLERLEISCDRLTNSHLLAMQGLPSLTSFDLDVTDRIDGRVYQEWVKSLPKYKGR
jgi:Leucine-rich repeat (LRR) protein